MSRADWSGAVQKLYRQRWRIWVVACLAHTIGMFHRAAMAPMADRLMADFNVTAVAFGSLGAVYFYVYAAMQLPAGTLADTVGPRKTITVGLLLSGVGSLIMSLAPSFGIVYLGRIMVTLGVSVVWLSVIKLVMEWFHRRESATMMGLSHAVVNSGQIAAATPLALLVMSVGWRMALLTIAQVTFGLAAANWFIVRDSPAKVGLPPIVEPGGEAIPQLEASGDPSGLSLVQRFKIVFSNKYLWPLFLLGLGTYGAFSTLFHNWAVVYLMQIYGVPRDFAANFALVAFIGIIVGGPVAGLLSDRIFYRRRLPALLLTGITFASFLILTLWNGGQPPLVAVYPLCFFMGLGAGAVPLTYACVRDVVHPSVRGVATGLVNMGFFVGAAVAQPLFGYILDLGWRGEMMAGARAYPLAAFQQGLWLCCLLAGLGFLGALLIRETRPPESHSVGD